jgi:SRSO17 transposase
MTPPVVVADAAYGTDAHLRAALNDRHLAYMLASRANVTAQPFDTEPEAPARNACRGTRVRGLHPSHLAAGSRGELRSPFAAVRVRPAGKAVERPLKAAASAEQG